MPREVGPSHPWHFGYQRDTRSDSPEPYWMTAARESRRLNEGTQTVTAKTGLVNTFSSSQSERVKALSAYEAKVINVCAKCFQMYQPIWRALRMELKRGQLTNHRGCVTNANFTAILEHYGISLSRTELGTVLRGFRVDGMPDAVNFEDFLKICHYAGEKFRSP